ncbi:MAG: hypothetical protein ACYTG5_16730 [Planctomycetota bacterium]|jgi:hypothetical protein
MMRVIPLLFATLLLPLAGLAQTPVRAIPLTKARQVSQDPGKASVAGEQDPNKQQDPSQQDPEAAAKAEEAKKKAEEAQKQQQEQQKKAQRLQKIQQLQFDRRPSAILAAWSVNQDDMEEEERKKAEEAEKAKAAGQPTPQPAQPAQPNIPPEVLANMPPGAVINMGAAPAPQPGTPGAEPDTFDKDLKDFVRNVTISDWAAVQTFIASLDEDLAKALYNKLLQGLNQPPRPRQGQRPVRGAPPEKNVFAFEDVVQLAAAAPMELEQAQLNLLGSLLRQTLAAGNVIESFVIRVQQELAKEEKERALSEREAIRILVAAGQVVEAGPFLPDIEKAKQEEDHQALNILATYYMALHGREKKVAHLESSWDATMAVFVSEKIKKEERKQALGRAVELAPKIREEFGQAWLAESFTSQPQRGMEIIAAIGTTSASAMQTQARQADRRLTGLKLQSSTVEALLKVAPELSQDWRSSLQILAQNWLNEAQYSYGNDQSTSIGPMMQRDAFGNFFYYNYNQFNRNQNQVQAIATGELLEIKPSEQWMQLLEESVRPKFSMVVAQLYLKVNEDDLAFPYIEDLAQTHPKQGKNLVEEYLRVWTRNHDPNSSRNRTNNYMFMYGFDQRAAGIPLTRSKQERNLTELAALVKRLRALPIEDPDEDLLSRAFMTCHSTAEVYRLESIERVFGEIGSLEPKTLASLVQKMRSNLIGVWSQPATQKDKGTRRRQKDIQNEILRGYQVAATVIDNSLVQHPSEWSLLLAKAAIEHDLNNFRKELGPSSEFSGRRNQSFASFETAASAYANTVLEAEEDKQSTEVFELWFYASLGACDLPKVSHEHQPDTRQPTQIREAILALPGEAAERHMSMFANTLFTRMSSVNPAVKFDYLRGGFEIVGDHKQAFEARKVFDYYHDLVTEIKLEAAIDGSDEIGNGEPFGLFVNLRHTREIERESGGFGKYLQNQNNATTFVYNYGRPLENYRDKFEEMAQTNLGEHFDVMSVTFQAEDVNSRATERYGWRVTPYAYIMLKARGPEIDKIPSLQLDLDFLDTSGYVVLPVASPAVPVDATGALGVMRPMQNLAISQTLDERQAAEGKLILEVKCSANGLIPDIDAIMELGSEGFEIVEKDDRGLSVSRFDESSEDASILSERTWMVTMVAEEDLAERPEWFEFGSSKYEGTDMVYQRFVDADLLEVEARFRLEEVYGETGFPWMWVVLPLLLLGSVLGFGIYRRTHRPVVVDPSLFQVPQRVTPFTVLGLLKRIREHEAIGAQYGEELDRVIGELEKVYFDDEDAPAPDLRRLAEEWVAKVVPVRAVG